MKYYAHHHNRHEEHVRLCHGDRDHGLYLASEPWKVRKESSKESGDRWRKQAKLKPIYSQSSPGVARPSDARINSGIKTTPTLQNPRPKMLAHGAHCSHCHQATRIENACLGNSNRRRPHATEPIIMTGQDEKTVHCKASTTATTR